MDLYQYKLFQPLSAAETAERQAQGTTYWSAYFDDEGRVLSAEKHSQSGSPMKIEYTYEKGRLSSVRQITPDGTSRERLRQK